MNSALKRHKRPVADHFLDRASLRVILTADPQDICEQVKALWEAPFFRRLEDELERALRQHADLAFLILEPFSHSKTQTDPILALAELVAHIRPLLDGGETLGRVGAERLGLIAPNAGRIKARAIAARLTEHRQNDESFSMRVGFSCISALSGQDHGDAQSMLLELYKHALVMLLRVEDANSDAPVDQADVARHFLVEPDEKKFLFFGGTS
jgi:hypothetical protein